MSYIVFEIKKGYLLEQLWAKAKRTQIFITIMISLLTLTTGLFILFMFKKTKEEYLQVRKLREEQNVKELVSIINRSIDDDYYINYNFWKIITSIYALIDLNRIEGKKAIEKIFLKQATNSRYKFEEKRKQHFETIFKQHDFSNCDNEIEIKRSLPKGRLLESYWEEVSSEFQANITGFLAVIFIAVLMPLVIIIPASITYFKSKKNYQKWSILKKEGSVEEILEMIAKEKGVTDASMISKMMGVYVLADREEPEAINEAKRLVHIFDTKINSNFGRYLDESNKEFLKTLSKPAKEQGRRKNRMITVTEVYFVTKTKIEKEKCMITGLPIEPITQEITVCPQCGKFAKRDLMEEWLKEKGYCPVCRTKLTIQDCPRVMIDVKIHK